MEPIGIISEIFSSIVNNKITRLSIVHFKHCTEKRGDAEIMTFDKELTLMLSLAIKNNESLTSINFNYMEIGEENAQILLRAFEKNTSIKEVKFGWFSKISDTTKNKFDQYIERNCQLAGKAYVKTYEDIFWQALTAKKSISDALYQFIKERFDYVIYGIEERYLASDFFKEKNISLREFLLSKMREYLEHKGESSSPCPTPPASSAAAMPPEPKFAVGHHTAKLLAEEKKQKSFIKI